MVQHPGSCWLCGQPTGCDCIDRIKHSESLLDQVGRDVTIKGRGMRYHSTCPLHSGSDNPYAFSMYYDRDGWHFKCHTRCHQQGDVFDYIALRHGVPTFIQQLEIITGRVKPLPIAKPVPVAHTDHDLGWQTVSAYHDALLVQQKVPWWFERGMLNEDIERWKLGYCTRCPTARFSPSYTIPITSCGKVLNIRHRLECPKNPHDKYRPEQGDLGLQLFNRDSLDFYADGDPRNEKSSILICEGEVKAMVLCRFGLEIEMPVITSTGGARSWLGQYAPEWVSLLRPFRHVFVCFDPDAQEDAERTAKLFGRRGHALELEQKVDDLLLASDDGICTFVNAMMESQPVLNRTYWGTALTP
jgi:hypothetical protein